MVRELRQKHVPRQSAAAAASTSATASASTPLITIDEVDPERGQDSKKRRVIVDRFARFKIGEAALADVAAAAHRDSPAPGGVNMTSGQSGPGSQGQMQGQAKEDYKTETYHMNMNPGEEMVHDSVGRKTFLGAPAGQSMLRRVGRPLFELSSAKGRFAN